MSQDALLTLGIETSNPSAQGSGSWRPEVVLARLGVGGEGFWCEREALDLSNPHDDDLMPAISRLCARVGVGPRAIRRIAVSVGPGGFTAVRIAVAAAKLIAEVTGAECVPVPSAWVAARAWSREHGGGGGVAVALAAKGPTAFVTEFAAGELPIATGPGRLMTGGEMRELPGRGVGVLLCDRFVIPIVGSPGDIPGLSVCEIGFDGLACVEMAELAAPVDPVELVPRYPREPEAVTKWRELKARKGG